MRNSSAPLSASPVGNFLWKRMAVWATSSSQIGEQGELCYTTMIWLKFVCRVTSEPKNATLGHQLHLCTETALWFVFFIFISISSLFI
jgi:hypothetical protein